MLISRLLLAVASFPALSEPIVNVPTANPTVGAFNIPGEPTTLALALTAVSIITGYFTLRRIWRPQQERIQKSLPPVHADAARIETPRRGAA